MRSLLPFSVVVFASMASLWGQQFVLQPGMIPGAAVWTEGVQAVDVDQDGDLDLCFANGDGFTSAGTQRQCGLLINQWVETGSLAFVDESVARLGTQLGNGKGLTAGDVNGDGWVDLLYLNAFNTDPPFLFINQGPGQPGYFVMESATRGFTESLSSAGAQFGDLDDDGDLDVIITDSGNAFLSGPGGKPRLYFNDGQGNFTEDAVAMNAPTKIAHMDVQLVDLDGDWNVDFFGANRGVNSGGYHYVMLNQGDGSFVDASSLLPATSGSVYEAEVGDLDGDQDVDLFFISLSGFQEGPVRNQLVENGSLGFSLGSPESGSLDDNEVVLLDFDNDGDLDAFIGSLGGPERAYRNDGAFNFVEQTGLISSIIDSTLDMTAGDLNNDGRYDLITAQGESNSAQFANKVYLNNGPADDRAPQLVDVHVPTQTIAWPVVLKVKYTDNVLDDGFDYVTSRAYAVPMLGTGDSTTLAGGNFSPAAVVLQAGEGLVFSNMSGGGTTLTGSGPTPFEIVLANTQAYERVFVRPGVYTVGSSTSAASLTVTVTGSATEVAGLPMGIGQHRFGVPQLAASPLNLLAAEVLLRDHPGNERWVEVPAVPYPSGGVQVYCSPAVTNTSGNQATIAMTGSFVVADQNFGLVASGLPLGEFGYFLVGQTPGFVPQPGGSFGNFCLGGALGRFNALAQIGNSGAQGMIALTVDLNGLPLSPPATVLAGDTYCFQAWFRDSLFVSSSFTDAIAVTFQ
ncbi:MAG: VCBS repeat-containing protein [Polyangiaceae bacterium]|nr:VCBS repeat-containing protein [Polyangiaceae bacterium]